MPGGLPGGWEMLKLRFDWYIRACSHESGGPQAGEVPRSGRITKLSIQSLFFLDHIYMLGGVPFQGGLPGQPVRVTRFGGVSFLHVKTAEWGNPPNWDNQITEAC